MLMVGFDLEQNREANLAVKMMPLLVLRCRLKV